MKELFPIALIAVILAVISHNTSVYDPIECRYHRKERFFYGIMAVVLIVFAGLRTGYNDTDTYRWMYDSVVKNIDMYGSLTDGIDWLKIGENPGFFFVMRIMAKLKFSTQSYIMAFSIFYVSVNLWFFKKYSCNIWMSIIVYIAFAGYVFSLAAIKQCTAMALCLLATDRAINKKYIQFVIFVLLGSLFHAYSLMYLIVPFLFFRPWSSYTVVMLIIFGAVGFGMQTLVGTLLDVTDMMGESYDASSFVGEGVHPMRLLVTAVPLFISALTTEQIRKHNERDQYVIVNLTMLNAEIMFVALFGTANYFARLANYFIPFQAVSIPWLLKHYDDRGESAIGTLAVCGYTAFFIYNYAIHENFDAGFYSVTLWEYLQSLF